MSKALSLLNGVLDYSEFKDVDMVIEVYIPTSLKLIVVYRMDNLDSIHKHTHVHTRTRTHTQIDLCPSKRI